MREKDYITLTEQMKDDLLTARQQIELLNQKVTRLEDQVYNLVDNLIKLQKKQ